MSTLVVQAEGRPGIATCHESLAIIGPGVAMTRSAVNGDWLSANGLSSTVSTGMDVVGFVVDPIASMAASVAGFLLDYMPPLPSFLDGLAGNPREVTAMAGTWENIADRMRAQSEAFDEEVRRALDGWSGPAAAAYGEFAGAYVQVVQGIATMAGGMGTVMRMASNVVALVRSIVRDLIADLVGKLISWASQVVATFGVGATWVVPQAVQTIARWVERAREWINSLTNAIRGACTAIDEIQAALTRSAPLISDLSRYLDGVSITPTGPGVPDVTLVELVPGAGAVHDGAVAGQGGGEP